jgi:hypothetical protein
MDIVQFNQAEFENLDIDELSAKLETFEKDNEQLRRENQLFDSYLARNLGE